jgi:hypothetical protein
VVKLATRGMNLRSIGHIRGLMLLLLLAGSEASGWILGGKRGGKDAPNERKVVQATLPPSTFVRIFALPSEEAKMGQVGSVQETSHLLELACTVKTSSNRPVHSENEGNYTLCA